MAGEKETAQAAQVEADKAQVVAAAATTVANVVEAAAADVAAAQEAAKDIAAAAIAAPLAQDIAALQRDAETWENEQEQLHANHANQFREIQSEISSLRMRLEALETPAVVIVKTPPADQSSIPPLSESETIAETVEATPAIVIEPEKIVPSENIPVERPRKARTRFL
jgi:hypothetical protein